MTLTNFRTYRIIGAGVSDVKEALKKYAKPNGGNHDFNLYNVNGIGVVLSGLRLSIASPHPEHKRKRSEIERILEVQLADISISSAELDKRNKRNSNNRNH